MTFLCFASVQLKKSRERRHKKTPRHYYIHILMCMLSWQIRRYPHYPIFSYIHLSVSYVSFLALSLIYINICFYAADAIIDYLFIYCCSLLCYGIFLSNKESAEGNNDVRTLRVNIQIKTMKMQQIKKRQAEHSRKLWQEDGSWPTRTHTAPNLPAGDNQAETNNLWLQLELN